MSENTYTIDFEGYWRKSKIESIPDESGIYCFYESKFNIEKRTITLLRLLYIGKSMNVRTRIKMHMNWDNWDSSIREGNEMCFSFAPVDTQNRDRIEAALIYKHKPLLNQKNLVSFEYDKTTIISTGKTALLNTNFTVQKDVEK